MESTGFFSSSSNKENLKSFLGPEEEIRQKKKSLRSWNQGNMITEQAKKTEEKNSLGSGKQETVATEKAKKKVEKERVVEWALLITSLVLEGVSAIFDQLGHAIIGMVMAFVALCLCIIELIYKAKMKRMKFERRKSLPISFSGNPNSQHREPFCTVTAYFGLVGGIWQCFYSMVEYNYSRQKLDNPIKMCLLPFIFLLGILFSNLIRIYSQHPNEGEIRKEEILPRRV